MSHELRFACSSRLAVFVPKGCLSRHKSSLLWALLLLVGAGCSEGDYEPRLISTERPTALVGASFEWGATSAERFRFRKSPEAAAGPSVHYETPKDWVELPTNSLRQANFLVNGDDSAECYLTVLSGTGGGLAGNVNRWRKQMSLDPLSDSEVAGLPRQEFFGRSSVRVDFAGKWTGMSGDESGDEYRLIGLLMVDDSSAKFLKMMGPAGIIEAAIPAFDGLAASFHGSETHEAAAHSTPPPSPEVAKSVAPQNSKSARGLTWQAPVNWTRGADRQMREVTFTIGDASALGECYVAILGGDGGGVFENINRWRQQMGATALSEAEFADLSSIPMCGTEAVFLQVEGEFTGMGGELIPKAILMGTIAVLSDRSVFVKLIGPMETLEGEREAFRTFCQSLSFGG